MSKQLPMQKDRTALIPHSIAWLAYEVYHHVHPGQSFERIHERGGFQSSEVIAFLYARLHPVEEWKDRAREAFEGMKP